MHLTDLSIKALKAPEHGQQTYTDDTLAGFGVRVSQGGVKSFVLVYGRSRRRVTIGRFPVVGLHDARKKAKELLAERTLGKRDVAPLTFEKALASYFAVQYPEGYPKPRTKAENQRLLNRHFLAPLRHEKLTAIRTQDITRILDALVDTPSEARHAFVAIRQLLNWLVGRGYLEVSPIAQLDTPAPSVPRDRVLTPKELRSVLRYAQTQQSAFAQIVMLLALTGQRRSEIASLKAEWIDWKAQTITLPRDVTKNKKSHTFPFETLTAKFLCGGKETGYLFPARGKDAPFNGWSKAKAAFDRGCEVTNWTLHDLRRTFATNLAALGVPVHVTEKLLNHISGTTAGIVAVYQRHAYEVEMRDAMRKWERAVSRLIAH